MRIPSRGFFIGVADPGPLFAAYFKEHATMQWFQGCADLRQNPSASRSPVAKPTLEQIGTHMPDSSAAVSDAQSSQRATARAVCSRASFASDDGTPYAPHCRERSIE